MKRLRFSWIVPTLYILFLLAPIYWLVNMSFKTNQEITSTFTLFPQTFTFGNYAVILTDPSWYMGYVNSLIYVVMNTVISLSVALPAAYAFSRYSFMGDKHLFFWLLTNRMSPPAVFALPFFQLYSSVGLFDTHIAVALAHCLFNVPLAVWILEGFMRGVPKEIESTQGQVAEALSETVQTICEAVMIALETTPPDLAADIVDRGVMLTGGGALLGDLDLALREQTGLIITVADQSLNCVALGTGKALEYEKQLRHAIDYDS